MYGPLINLEERPGLDKKRHLKNFNERHSKLNSIKEKTFMVGIKVKAVGDYVFISSGFSSGGPIRNRMRWIAVWP